MVLQTGQTSPAQAIAFSPDGKLLASSGWMELGVRVWETNSGRQLALLSRHAASSGAILSGVTALSFSADGMLVAAGFGDNGVAIWEVDSGDEVAAIPGSGNILRSMLGVRGVSFSPDGKYLLTIEGLGAKVWDLSTGAPVREIPMMAPTMVQSGQCRAAAFSPNGQEVIVLGVSSENAPMVVRRKIGTATPVGKITVSFTDIASGKVTRTVDVEMTTADICVLTTIDGRELVTTGGADEAKVWDVSRASGGAPAHTVPRPNSRTESGYPTLQAQSGNGRLAAFALHNNLYVWDLNSSRQLFAKAIEKSPLFQMANEIGALEFSSDGKLLAAGTYDGKTRIFDGLTGQPIRTLEGRVNVSFSVALDTAHGRLYSGQKTAWNLQSGRGEQILAGVPGTMGVLGRGGAVLAEPSQDSGDVRIWNVVTGAQVSTLSPGWGAIPDEIVFSPSARIAAVTYRPGTIQGPDASQPSSTAAASPAAPLVLLPPSQKSKGKKSSRGDLTAVMQQAMQAAQARAAANVTQSPNPVTHVRIFDVATGASIADLPTTATTGAYTTNIDFSPDERSVAVATLAGIEIWDVATQSKKSVLAPPTDSSGIDFLAMSGYARQIQSLHFSPDGRYLAAALRDSSGMMAGLSQGMAQQLSSATKAVHRGVGGIFFPQLGRPGKATRTLGKNATGMNQMSFQVAGPIELWDTTKGQKVLSLPGHANGAGALAYSPDGKLLATTGADDDVKVWDLLAGKELKTLKGHTARVMALAIDSGNTLLATASADGTTQLWDLKTGETLATLLSLYDGQEWLVVTPDGLFDGSPAAWNQILWRFGGNIFDAASVESFFNEYYYPDLLADIFSGKRPLATNDIATKDRRQPHLAMSVPGTGDATAVNVKELTVNVTVDSAPAGARDVRLFRNGSLVKIWRGDVLAGKDRAVLTATIPIVSGRNRLSAYAFNSDNIKSIDAALDVTGGDSLKRRPVAYILAIGINKYANGDYNLRFATADAEAFAAQVQKELNKQERFERLDVTVLSDQNATKNNILKAIEDFADRVQPEDELFVFVASHGTAAQDRFFLIPYDLGYQGSHSALDEQAVRSILQHSVSDRELEEAFEKVDAGRILLVLDACNSGQALEADEKRRGPMNSRGLAQLAYEKGMYILTASQSYQAAQEVSRIGHGLLTYALVVEGLEKGLADFEPRDGQVVIREWLDYADSRVPQLQLEEMEQSRRLGRNLSFGTSRPAARGLASDGAEIIQQPKLFYRRELEAMPWVVSQPRD